MIETSEEDIRVERRVAEYEKEGMWSHAAELADKHSEKTKDKKLKMRAFEDYEETGYDARSLARAVSLLQEIEGD